VLGKGSNNNGTENVSVRLTASDHCVTQMLGQTARLHMVLVIYGYKLERFNMIGLS
jgi:hypothetical protein